MNVRNKLHVHLRLITQELYLARGYFVSTVWRDEEMMREYIGHQEAEDERSREGVTCTHRQNINNNLIECP